MGMAQGAGEELAPRGRTGYSDAELVRAEGNLLTALSAKQRHGRPPGVSALPRNPHPITLRPLPPPPPPPPPAPPPPRRPPALHTLSHHAAREPLLPNVTSGRRWLGRGRTLVGAGEVRGRETPWELVSQNAAPRRRRAQSAGRHFG